MNKSTYPYSVLAETLEYEALRINHWTNPRTKTVMKIQKALTSAHSALRAARHRLAVASQTPGEWLLDFTFLGS